MELKEDGEDAVSAAPSSVNAVSLARLAECTDLEHIKADPVAKDIGMEQTGANSNRRRLSGVRRRELHDYSMN